MTDMTKTIYVMTGALLASASMLFGTENATLRIVKNDGSVTEKNVALEKIGENKTKLVVNTADIGKDVNYIDVVADNAKAKKGEKGFWMCHRGILGKFVNDNGLYTRRRQYFDIPYYAMQTERENFIGIVEGMRFECEMRVEAKNGNYEMFPRFRVDKYSLGGDPYENIEIVYYKLPDDADYNEMAKTYRRHKFAKDPDIKPLKERFKTQKHLEEQSKAMHLTMSFGHKVIKAEDLPKHRKTDYTYENEPKVVSRPFSDGTKILQAIKDSGVDKVYVYTEGWQDGGYGGRTPSTWPICKEAGGEAELIKYIKAGQAMGYLIDAHVDYTDTYTCSRDFTPDMVCKSPDGKLEINGGWAGGKAYNLCMDYMWNKWNAPAELERIRKELGFEGGLFYDVFGAVYPYRCCDPKHPMNRRQGCAYHKLALQKARALFGVVGAECAFDDNAGQTDFINYPSSSMKQLLQTENTPVDKGSLSYVVVPFYELVYHDIIIGVTYHMTTIPKDFYFSKDEDNVNAKLKMVEFCGRPLLYGVNMDTVPSVKAAYDFYKTYRDLTPEEMTRHSKVADGVYKTEFADGSYTIVNYNDKEHNHNGRFIVPAKGYQIVRK
jgi:hypothetical protein